MPFKPCREGDEKVSTGPRAGPKRGVRRPTKPSAGKTIVATFFALVLVSLMIRASGNSSPDGLSTVVPLTPVALDADAVQGHVLPIKVISAIRNFGFKEGVVGLCSRLRRVGQTPPEADGVSDQWSGSIGCQAAGSAAIGPPAALEGCQPGRRQPDRRRRALHRAHPARLDVACGADAPFKDRPLLSRCSVCWKNS
jgi:hypothetical protein